MQHLYEVILRIQYVYTDRGTYIHLTSFKVNNVNMIKKFFEKNSNHPIFPLSVGSNYLRKDVAPLGLFHFY